MKQLFDTTIRPQDDFFGYVNNPWLRDNPIPASENAWGTFYVLRDQAVAAVHDILETIAHSDESLLSHDDILLKQVYRSALSYTEHTVAHTNTLRTEIDRIRAITTPHQLASYLGYAHRRGYDPFWTTYVGLDDKNSTTQVLRLYQSGLGLPNRDYYREASKHMATIRKRYETFYTTVISLLSSPLNLDNAWKAVWDIEHELASYSWTDVALRDVQKNYTKVSVKELKQRLSRFHWDEYFTALGWQTPTDHCVIDQYEYVERCVAFMDNHPLANIKAYLEWNVINSHLAWFDEETSALNFDFYGRTINGSQEQKPLWKRASLLLDNLVIGELIGREYARRYFPEQSKQAVLAIVEDIRRAYHRRIDNLTWMSDTTKQRAHTKLDNLRVFIGYPSVWKDFSRLTCSSDNVLNNILTLREFETDLQLAKIGQPPATEEWEMNAHTVNAYHHPQRLEIVFPAAILQPPFFDPTASYASNIGGIGAVIGHELTHGFDDQGSEFDEHGNSYPWQNEQERTAFFERAESIVRIADAYETAPHVYLQGKLILGEAIADIGGLELAVEAVTHRETDTERRTTALHELFINFARTECGQATTERRIQLAKIDPHPPSSFRVNCVVNHIDAFYDHFGLTPQDKLYLEPEQRAHIW